MKITNKQKKRKQRKLRSKLIKGSLARPRVVLSKSNRYLVAQAIDDDRGHTLLCLNTIGLEKTLSSSEKGKTSQCRKNKEWAKKLGQAMADKLKKQSIQQIVFDRNGYPYHGKIENFCNAIRKERIKF